MFFALNYKGMSSNPRANVKNRFKTSIAMLHLKKALWLVWNCNVNCHVQSECFISAKYCYITLKFVCDIGSWTVDADKSIKKSKFKEVRLVITDCNWFKLFNVFVLSWILLFLKLNKIAVRELGANFAFTHGVWKYDFSAFLPGWMTAYWRPEAERWFVHWGMRGWGRAGGRWGWTCTSCCSTYIKKVFFCWLGHLNMSFYYPSSHRGREVVYFLYFNLWSYLCQPLLEEMVVVRYDHILIYTKRFIVVTIWMNNVALKW